MNKKYLAAAALAGSMSILPLAGHASATTVNNGSATIPVKLTVPDSATTGIDVTIGDNTGTSGGIGAEQILMTMSSKNSNTATVTPLLIKNNAGSSPVYVKGIKVQNHAESGYTVVAYNETEFKTYETDSKKIALKYGETDLSTGWTGSQSIAAGGTFTANLSGLASNSSTEINPAVQVADCVITLSQKSSN